MRNGTFSRRPLLLGALAVVLVAGAATEMASGLVLGRGTRAHPHPLRSFASVPESSGWRIRVNKSIPNSTRLVMAENQFNDRPASGRQFFIVNVTARYTGKGPAHRSLGCRFTRSAGRMSRTTTRMTAELCHASWTSSRRSFGAEHLAVTSAFLSRRVTHAASSYSLSRFFRYATHACFSERGKYPARGKPRAGPTVSRILNERVWHQTLAHTSMSL